MGISRGAIKLIGMTLGQHDHAGDIVTFGVQQTNTEYNEAVALLSETRVTVAPLVRKEIRRDYVAPGLIHQDVLFQLLGFRAIESIDFYPAEGRTHALDLNFPVPDSIQGRFDLVYDGGTSEHCFAVPEVLSNAIRLLKVGGRVIHHLPLNNRVDHGFYQFSPTLFFDVYKANEFDQLRMAIHFMMGKKERYIAYDPRKDGNLPYSLKIIGDVPRFSE